jgi:Krev interaction trapped protein 1
MERPSVTITGLNQSPADMVVKNPLFSSGLKLSKVDVMVVNQHFGRGVPDYDSLRERQGEWAVHVEGDGMQDWVDLFPMHKCACEGDVEGVRRCVQIGVSPDERDSDSWAPLHYACWYGELEVVKVLVEEASADLGVINNTDSTPLHLAAATGHSEVVAYLLRQPGIRLVQTAIDCEGKSPLAVCLECRQKEWSETRRLLQEAYKTAAVQHNLTRSPSLLSHPSPPHNLRETSLQPVLLQSDLKSLSECGSQASLSRRAVPGKERERVVRRQRVDFVSGQHHLAHFSHGKDTPTTNVLKDIYNLIQLAPRYHNMLALWIQSDSLAIQLGDGDKPLSLMSNWPSLLTRHVAKTTVAEVPSLCVRRNVFISQTMERSISDPNILEILFFDARRHVLTGQYPCTEEDAIELGGLFMQVSYGDHTPMVHHSGFLQGHLKEVLPVAMATSKRRVEFERRVLAQHSKISQDHSQNGDSQAHLHKMYLQKCWQWPFYGSAFFPGSLATKSCQLPKQVKLGRKAHVPVSVAINTLGFHLISMETNSLVISLSYGAVKWDISINKHRLLLSNTDNSLHIEIHTKMAELLNSLVSRMTEQYLHGSHSNTSATPTPQTQHDA